MCAIAVRSNVPNGLGPGALLAALLCAFADVGWAFDDDTAVVAAQSDFAGTGQRPRSQFEISTSSLPRFDAESQARSSRIDMTLLPPGRSAMGLSLGLADFDRPVFPGLAPYPNLGPNMHIGLHWRYTTDSNYRVDVTAWRRMAIPDAIDLVQSRQPSYGARMEMQLPAPHNGFVAEKGFLGLQLDDGGRVTLRRRSGGPMIYYRNNF